MQREEPGTRGWVGLICGPCSNGAHLTRPPATPTGSAPGCTAATLTQERRELAARATFDRKGVNRMGNGGYSPSLDRVFVIADALGVEVAELFIADG